MVGVFDKNIPNGKFPTLKSLIRYRNLCLWLPIERTCNEIPWGYKLCEEDKSILVPCEEARIYFIQAQEYLKAHSYKEVAEWLQSVGFPITAQGLKQVLMLRPYWNEMCLPFEERLACRT